MAEIRVERKAGTKPWLWILLALVVLALALFLLYRGGYIGGVALDVDLTEVQHTPLARLAFTAASHLQEVFHG
jgi:hypothetical protein